MTANRTQEERAEELLRQLRDNVVRPANPRATPRATILLLAEGAGPFLLWREQLGADLAKLGLRFGQLDQALRDIASSPLDDDRHYPVLILVEGYAQVSFIESILLVRGRGGDA